MAPPGSYDVEYVFFFFFFPSPGLPLFSTDYREQSPSFVCSERTNTVLLQYYCCCYYYDAVLTLCIGREGRQVTMHRVLSKD
jgi:hypothetical protein